MDIFGEPRSTNGIPDICGFRLAKNIRFWKGAEAPFVLRKAVGLFLRMGIEPRGWEKVRVLNFLYKYILSCMVSLFFGERIEVVNGKDVGYTDIRVSKRKILLAGYFQSHRYAKNFKSHFEDLQLVQNRIDREKSVASDFSNRLIVHLRLTDYLLEEHFGIPNENYYKNALNIILKLRKFEEVWVFSDDINTAKRLLRLPPRLKISWMKCEQLNPYEVLDLMRLASGYIIANSTFSWWAAYLSQCDNPIVIAPNPWFKGMPSPRHLIPQNWTTVEAWS